MNERQINERDFSRGEKAAWRRMLAECIKWLREDAEPMTAEQLLLERTEAIAMLRIVCAEHGDNDWPDRLHLADIIDKHLAKHLPQGEEESEEE
jgi:predicted secreted protein